MIKLAQVFVQIMKGRFIVIFLLLIISQMNSSSIVGDEMQSPGYYEQVLQGDVFSTDYKKIGYYTNSSSEFANAVYPLLKYNSFGHC